MSNDRRDMGHLLSISLVYKNLDTDAPRKNLYLGNPKYDVFIHKVSILGWRNLPFKSIFND